MADTRTWPASPTRATACRTSAAGSPGRPVRRGRRAGPRLWALLNAQALIRGPLGGPGSAAVEDDRGRLAARRER